MKLLFDSIWNIVTWVGMGLSIGAIFLFWSKGEWTSVFWSVAALVGCIVIMLLLLGTQHFWGSANKQILEKRTLVDIEPTYITDFFKDRTDFLGNRLLEPYKGKWMKVTFSVANVHDHAGFTQVIGWINKDNPDKVQISASFDEKLEREHAQLFRVGEEVTIAGKIDGADRRTIQLEDCRLP